MTYLRLTPERPPSDAERASGPDEAEVEHADEMHRAAAARFERFERDRAAGEGMFDVPARTRRPEDEDR